MKIKNSLLLITSIFLSSTAFAEYDYGHGEFEPHPYFGLGYTFADIELDLSGYGLGTPSADNGLLGAIFGYRFHKNFALDFRGYGNTSDDDIYGVNVEIDRMYSVLAKGILPVNDNVYFYGMVGAGDTKATASAGGISLSDSDEDFQYGVGMSVTNGTPLETQIEWMKLYDDDGLEITGININIVYNF